MGRKRALKARHPKEKCVEWRCRNRKGKKASRCPRCHSRYFKARYLEKYVLNILRVHARHRGIPCSLTLDEFQAFCALTGYLEKRGPGKNLFTVGRINHDHGYHHWNIKIEEHTENSVNGHVVPGRETKQNESVDYQATDPTVSGLSEGDPF